MYFIVGIIYWWGISCLAVIKKLCNLQQKQTEPYKMGNKMCVDVYKFVDMKHKLYILMLL